MSLVLQSSGGGSVTLEEPTTASNFTITVPAVSGTMITTASTFAGTGPAFSAYQSSAQTPSAGVYTKVQFQSEEFDTNSNFDTSTYRFTPTVAGYYQISCGVRQNASNSRAILEIYKNGSTNKILQDNASSNYTVGGSSLFYANGSTDYFEVYFYTNSATALGSSSTQTYFNGAMVRAA
jgi:hypothetical protein